MYTGVARLGRQGWSDFRVKAESMDRPTGWGVHVCMYVHVYVHVCACVYMYDVYVCLALYSYTAIHPLHSTTLYSTPLYVFRPRGYR
jgi:hypothetical protein